MSWNATTRQASILSHQQQEYDLCVIGGGINGAGVARDAASRGLSVALVEAQDFAAGTSSRSSKIAHGGLRYLENYDFGLVFEALSEKINLLEIAPHLVRPMDFLLPVYKGDRVSPFVAGLGMWAYDALSLFRSSKLHRSLDSKESQSFMPHLRSENLLKSYMYSDAIMDDAALVVETLRSAKEWGAHCVNYTKAVGAKLKDGKVVSIEVQDQMDQNHYHIKAKHFISTVGPWTDQLGQHLLPSHKTLLQPQKGVHLTFAAKDLPLPSAVVVATRSDHRVVFMIPRGEFVIVGTTDTAYEGDPQNVEVELEDVDYLLGILNEYFPHLNFNAEKILASYAGVRPLAKEEEEQSVYMMSRDFRIIEDPRNITFLIGGKYTTYRSMSEKTVDTVIKHFPLEKKATFKQSQTLQAINPRVTPGSYAWAQSQVDNLKNDLNISIEDSKKLLIRYGAEAFDFSRWNEEAKEVPAEAKTWVLEAHHCAAHTMCLNAEDFLNYRTFLAISRADHGCCILDFVRPAFR